MLTRFSPLLSEDERTEQISLLNSSKKSEKVYFWGNQFFHILFLLFLSNLITLFKKHYKQSL